MARILVISFSDLARDPRVDRQISFLRARHEVIGAGIAPPVDADVEFVDLGEPSRTGAAEALRRARSVGLLAVHRYAGVYWRHPSNRAAVARLAGHRADLIIANDLSALPIACRVARGTPVVFDAHELATEEHAERTWWRLLMKPYMDGLLREYLPHTAAMMTVSHGIANAYAERYGVDPVVVTNAPPYTDLRPTPVGERIRLVHHGAAHRARRPEALIEAVGLLDDHFELDLLMVPGERRYFAHLQQLVERQPRVRLVDPVPQREITRWCNAYDVGVLMLPPENRNNLYALPNKLFEFVQARLAVATGPSPEMERVVREHDCGVVADGFTPAALASALRSLSPERIAEYKLHADRAAGALSAEQNREKVLGLVDRALATSTHPAA